MSSLRYPDFGSWVKDRRRSHLGLTQDELAKLVGCALTTIHAIEQNKVNYRPSKGMVQLLARHLGISNEEYPSFLALARRVPEKGRGLETGRLETGENPQSAIAMYPSPNPQLVEEPVGRPPATYHYLPRPPAHFQGRDAEIDQALTWLAPDHPAAVVVVYGMGGIGKTALATVVGHACRPGGMAPLQPAYDAVVFVSARDQVFTLADVLDQTAQVLGLPFYAADKKLHIVRHLLSERRVLLILDNFDSLDDPALLRFALEGVPPPSKVLITTRELDSRFLLHTWPLHLQGLNDSAACRLIEHWASGRPRSRLPMASDAELEVEFDPLLQVTKGNPYALLMAVALIAGYDRPLPVVVGDLQQGRGDVFEYIFQLNWSLMTDEEQRLLLVMPFFAAPATQEAIGAAAGVSGRFLPHGLDRLVNLSLLMREEAEQSAMPRYYVHPLTKAFAQARLDQVADWEQEARARWADYYAHHIPRYLRSGRLTEPYWDSLLSANYLWIDAEWPTVHQVLLWADHASQSHVLVELMSCLVHYMGSRVRWSERLYFAGQAAQAAQFLNQPAYEALFRMDARGWVLMEQGRYEEAAAEINKGLEAANRLEMESTTRFDLLALGYTFHARRLLMQRKLPDATSWIKRAMALPCSPVVGSRVRIIAGEVALAQGEQFAAHSQQGQRFGKEALRLFVEAQQLGLSYGGEENDMEWHYRFGLAHLLLGNWQQAETELQYIETISGVDPRMKLDALYARFGLARLAAARSDFERALQLAESVRDELLPLVERHQLLERVRAFVSQLA